MFEGDGARCFHTARIAIRGYDELVGLCKGVIADGQVNQAEAEFLLNWLQAHPDVAEMFPASTLTERLAGMLADGRLDRDEADELLFLLRDMTGEKGQQARGAAPTQLAFDDPMPPLDFAERYFCLTGTFQSGGRREIEAKLESVGAAVGKTVAKTKPGCLVVGSLVTESWMYSTHGRKLEAAVDYRSQGCPIIVVSEDHLWDEMTRLGML